MFKIDQEFRDEFRANRLTLIVVIVLVMIAVGAPTYSSPFLVNAVIQEYGWTREQAILVISLKYLTGALFSILIGYFIDSVGIKRMLVVMTALAGVALNVFLFADNLTVYYLAGVLLGIASPGLMVAGKVLVSRTYLNCQGTAMGFVLLGGSLGGAAVTAAIPYVFGAVGWQLGMASLSVGIWFIVLPMILLVPAGIFSVSGEPGRAPDEQSAEQPGRGVVMELMSDYRFWVIGFAVFIAGFVDLAFYQHQVVYLEVDIGMDSETVGWALATLLLIGTWCRPFVGNIFDALSVRGVSMMYTILAISCLLALGVLNPAIFMAFIVLRAVAHAAVMMDTIILTKHVLGTRHLGLLLGIYTGCVNAGYASGPWVMARMYDKLGSYTLSFYLFAGFALIAAVLLLTLKPVFWLEAKQKASTVTA